MLPVYFSESIISAGEGDVPISRWQFLEQYAARRYGIACRVYAHRQDNNYATGSFKDLAGSLVASALNENRIYDYVIASTGNIGVAYSRYISNYGGRLYVFIPEKCSEFKYAESAMFSQKVFRVQGDYDLAKTMSVEFAERHGLLTPRGVFDPLRIEAKKTMAFEWYRLLKVFPTVYIQALSGGTGPLGIHKGCLELKAAGIIDSLPRHVLVQSDRCCPMADAWTQAEESGFLPGWENAYRKVTHIDTRVPTLATGNPSGYPKLSNIVRKTGGGILSIPEDLIAYIARVVAYEVAVRIGPAAAVGVGGFFAALKRGYLVPGDIVLINIGEGVRRDPAFMLEVAQTIDNVASVSDCSLFDRGQYGHRLWDVLDSKLENL